MLLSKKMILELIFGIKVETINLLRNADLTEKKQNIIKDTKPLSYIKLDQKL